MFLKNHLILLKTIISLQATFFSNVRIFIFKIQKAQHKKILFLKKGKKNTRNFSFIKSNHISMKFSPKN